ncbi:hypothetical protein WEU38_11890 [Cyanobacterium aponinum AL20118]|uniref:Uncharacterized protein n=1 Tax=Cyanobacterium aponinum AL20115 TaxID=3090662 RepID=A0AAF0Z790_9CHRO|nr:hypothetical protein [Cyanobacterium aponinum]WPF87511.1 hypothetical protein SAY89_11920 [Cyanobacterium aponinum AL20115]
MGDIVGGGVDVGDIDGSGFTVDDGSVDVVGDNEELIEVELLKDVLLL